MLGYHGDLGLDDGRPQSVYELDTDRMEKFTKADGSDFRLDLAPGQTVRLPDGLGTVRFNDVQRWVKLQVSHTPGKGIALGGIVAGLVGLMGSLFIRRRRVWVRVAPGTAGTGGAGGAAYVEVAGLDRSTVAEGLDEELRTLAGAAAGTGHTGAGGGTATQPSHSDDEER
jgi:cytochrome c biogenesis protein